jgi:hypothetical protein
VPVERLLVEGEVRRADHRNRVGARLYRVPRQVDRGRRRLGAAVNGHLEPLRRHREEELRGALAFLYGEQDPLSGRPQRQDPVEAACDEEVDVGRERVLVQRRTVSSERRDRRGQAASQHETTLRSRP